MRKSLVEIAVFVLALTWFQAKPVSGQTYCNPLSLNRQYTKTNGTDKSLSNPTVTFFNGKYYLFATNAGGYWCSTNLASWKFIDGGSVFSDKKEPTVTVIDNWLYLFSSFTATIYRTQNPDSGKWEEYAQSALLAQIGDFSIFTDTDGKVYCYYGCTNNSGVMFRELDTKNHLNPMGSPITCSLKNTIKTVQKKASTTLAESHTSTKGSWMTKHNGKYYYMCAEMNKGINNFSDVVYVSDNPLGPFEYAANNPISFIPSGYISGASKGSTFTDQYNNWWYIAGVSLHSARNQQTQLALFPAGFDEEGNLFVKSDFGDYPIHIPNGNINDIDKLNPEWALISDEAKAQSSSSAFPDMDAIDDDINTFWSAKTGKRGEWFSLDLGSECTLNALQVNFSPNKITPNVSDSVKAYQYLIEYSENGRNWKKLMDQTLNTVYEPVLYREFQTPVQARYLKITNYTVPEGTFAISEWRIFGLGSNRRPKKINEFKVLRDFRDSQSVTLFWKKQVNTTGFNIRYGTEKDKLFHSYQVNNTTTKITIHCPDKNKAYWFQIDAFNANGVAEGKPVMCR